MQHRCSMLQFRTTETTSHMSYQPSGEQRDEKTVSRVGRQFSFPAKTLLWYETVVKNCNGTALPDLFSKIFYFIPPEAMSDFLKYDNLLLFLIVKSSAGEKRYFMYSTVLTLDFLFSILLHSPPLHVSGTLQWYPWQSIKSQFLLHNSGTSVSPDTCYHSSVISSI